MQSLWWRLNASRGSYLFELLSKLSPCSAKNKGVFKHILSNWYYCTYKHGMENDQAVLFGTCVLYKRVNIE